MGLKLVSLVLAEFLLTYSFLFIVSAVKATPLIEQELVMNLFYLCIVQTTLFLQITVTSSHSMQNGIVTPLTQWHKAEKPRSGAIAEALKSRDAQYDAEQYRHGVTESGQQGWHWRETLHL